MKRKLFFLLLLVACFSGREMLAQQVVKKTTAKAKDSTKKVQKVPVLLGGLAINQTNVPKAAFDVALRKGVHVADTVKGTITGFMFGYKERSLYEDSVGRMMIVADYMSEYCQGDTLSPAISAMIFERTKPGDTAYIDNIKVLLPDGKQAVGKELKFIIR